MTLDESACPYCNGALPAVLASPTVDKLPCPRCGEPVPAARWPVYTASAAGEPARPTEVAAIRGPGQRKTLLVILGIMLAMAILSLSYALWTTKLRQSRHPWMPAKLETVPFRTPMQLPGLDYLPKGTQIVVALQIVEWLNDPATRRLLDEPRPAPIDWVLKQITRATGLKLEEVDHVIAASTLDTQLVLIVQTRQPYSLTKIVETVQPVRSSSYLTKPLYEFALKPAGEAMLWCVEERIMIFVLRLDTPKVEHLSGLSATPRKLDEVLPATLVKTMEERLAKRNLLWAVGRLDQPGLLMPLLLGGRGELGWVRDIRTFALGVEPGDDLTLTGHFLMKDAKSAAKLKTVLEDTKFDGVKSQKVEMAPDEPWLTWQLRSDVAALRAMLERGKK